VLAWAACPDICPLPPPPVVALFSNILNPPYTAITLLYPSPGFSLVCAALPRVPPCHGAFLPVSAVTCPLPTHAYHHNSCCYRATANSTRALRAPRFPVCLPFYLRLLLHCRWPRLPPVITTAQLPLPCRYCVCTTTTATTAPTLPLWLRPVDMNVRRTVRFGISLYPTWTRQHGRGQDNAIPRYMQPWWLRRFAAAAWLPFFCQLPTLPAAMFVLFHVPTRACASPLPHLFNFAWLYRCPPEGRSARLPVPPVNGDTDVLRANTYPYYLPAPLHTLPRSHLLPASSVWAFRVPDRLPGGCMDGRIPPRNSLLRDRTTAWTPAPFAPTPVLPRTNASQPAVAWKTRHAPAYLCAWHHTHKPPIRATFMQFLHQTWTLFGLIPFCATRRFSVPLYTRVAAHGFWTGCVGFVYGLRTRARRETVIPITVSTLPDFSHYLTFLFRLQRDVMWRRLQPAALLLYGPSHLHRLLRCLYCNICNRTSVVRWLLPALRAIRRLGRGHSPPTFSLPRLPYTTTAGSPAISHMVLPRHPAHAFTFPPAFPTSCLPPRAPSLHNTAFLPYVLDLTPYATTHLHPHTPPTTPKTRLRPRISSRLRSVGLRLRANGGTRCRPPCLTCHLCY